MLTQIDGTMGRAGGKVVKQRYYVTHGSINPGRGGIRGNDGYLRKGTRIVNKKEEDTKSTGSGNIYYVECKAGRPMEK